MYYSILNKDKCGVSAILLRDEIDVGEIVFKEKYDLPPIGLNIDYTYDIAIRSDVLIKTIELWTVNKSSKASDPRIISLVRFTMLYTHYSNILQL